MKTFCTWSLALACAVLSFAETKSDQTESIAVAGKKIVVSYSTPAVNGRVGKLFGKDGTIGGDPNYPVWRAGANGATTLHTEAALEIGGLAVPKGDYSLFVNLANPTSWELIVNKQTGQSGLEYDSKQDLGRVKMSMAKPPATVEQLKYTLANAGANQVKLLLSWENQTASVILKLK